MLFIISIWMSQQQNSASPNSRFLPSDFFACLKVGYHHPPGQVHWSEAPKIFGHLSSSTSILKLLSFLFILTSEQHSKLSCCLVAKPCPGHDQLLWPRGLQPTGLSSVYGISQARNPLEWVAISIQGSSRPKEQPTSAALAGRFFHHGATWKAPNHLTLP